MTKRKLVSVEWVDSAMTNGWRHIGPETDLSPSKCHSVGFVLKDDKEGIALSQSISDNGGTDTILSIPRCAILKKRGLK